VTSVDGAGRRSPHFSPHTVDLTVTTKKAKDVARHGPFERVYFIGAGFSAGMQYPAGPMLMPRLVEYLLGQRLHPGGYFRNSVRGSESARRQAARIITVIERVLKTYFATGLSALERVDVAEFFTLAQTLSERSWMGDHGTAGTRAGIGVDGEPSERTLFNDLAAVTRSYFVDLSVAFDYPADIDAVLRLVRPRQDAIINFNWDEEVDIWFSSGAKEDVCYTIGAHHGARETLVLKPHGSIGWYDLQRGIGNEDAYLIAMADHRIPRYDKRILAYTDNDLPLELDGDGYHPALTCPPVITAPTFAKRFDYIEQQRIWQDVLEVCRNARDFIFLGYSLPKDDFLTRAAIRAAISKNRVRDVRCLVVDRALDDMKRLNFMSVFGALSPDRNHLKWDFGCGKRSLRDQLEEKLEGAFVVPG
jgi:hypothetical protein